MSSQKIEPYEAGYEYAYLTGPLKNQYKTIVDIEATLKTPFKGWLGMDSNWTKGNNQYYQDVNNDLYVGHNVENKNENDKYGPTGPLSFIYKKNGGKKSKRRGSQKKRKTRRSRK